MPVYLIGIALTQTFDTLVDTDERFIGFARTDMDTFHDCYHLYGRIYKVFRQWGGGIATRVTVNINLN